MIYIIQSMPREQRMVYNLSIIDETTTSEITRLLDIGQKDIWDILALSRANIKKVIWFKD